VYKAWPELAGELAQTVRGHDAVLDDELCCLAPDGRSQFYSPDVSARPPVLHGVRSAHVSSWMRYLQGKARRNASRSTTAADDFLWSTFASM
jgi:hypothetical protein